MTEKEICIEDLKCENLSESQCSDLRDMKFSNNPKEIFLEIRSLEERYLYTISQSEEKWANEIAKAKEKYT